MASVGRRAFVGFLEKKEKKVIQDLRAAQGPEALRGTMARRASQEIPVIQDQTVTSEDRRAPKGNKEDRAGLDRKGHQAVPVPEESGVERARGESQVPQGSQEPLDHKVHPELKGYKAHRGYVEVLAGKENKEARGPKDLRVLLGQWERRGALEDPGLRAGRENLGCLGTQGQRGQLDSEEDREIMASQAMGRWDEKE